VAELKERCADLRLDDHSHTFNTELTTALELSYMLDVAEAVVHSALGRRESRGSHQRSDHPERDDQRFLAHSLAWRTASGPPRIEYAPVSITRWPPGQRVYGR
jgi:fumarate reductase flavoprotein subunit